MPVVASPSGNGNTATPMPSAHILACTSRLLLRNAVRARGSIACSQLSSGMPAKAESSASKALPAPSPATGCGSPWRT